MIEQEGMEISPGDICGQMAAIRGGKTRVLAKDGEEFSFHDGWSIEVHAMIPITGTLWPPLKLPTRDLKM